MTNITFRKCAYSLLTLLLSIGIAAAAPTALTDSELDTVYAAGFNISIDLGFDIAATNPDAVLVQTGDPAALQQFLNQGLAMTSSTDFGSRNIGALDPSGAYMPNLQNLVVNNINIAADALSNATTLMNIFALQGDVAVGLNLNVVVNPTNCAFDISQTNINWGTFNLSDAFLTPGFTGSN